MAGKFDNVPVEEDTRITAHREGTLGAIDALYQEWFSEGIAAASLIFVANDVSELTDAELEKEVRSSGLVDPDSQMTITRDRKGYTFANFNFVSD